MRNFQDTFEARKRSFISGFSVCMNVPLMFYEQIKTNMMYKISVKSKKLILEGIDALQIFSDS